MEVFTGITSFRTASDSRPFIIHVGEEEFVAIDKGVFCTRFWLLESTLLVEREELDENGSIVRKIYVRPISTDRGLQFRVGAGSYTVMGVQSNLGLSQSSSFSPRSFSSLDRRACRSMISLLPPIAKVLEQSVEEISSDGSFVAATMLLDSDSRAKTVIVSSQRNRDLGDGGASSSDGLQETPYPSFSRQPSPTSTVPTHASETPSKMSKPRSLVYVTSSESIDCKVFKRGVSNPRSNSKTLCEQQSLAISCGSTGKASNSAGCCNSIVISIYDSLLSLGSHRAGRSKLKNVDLSSFSDQKLNYLPMRYNRNIVFELPPFPMSKVVELQYWRAWIGGERDMLRQRRLLQILLIRMGSFRLGT